MKVLWRIIWKVITLSKLATSFNVMPILFILQPSESDIPNGETSLSFSEADQVITPVNIVGIVFNHALQQQSGCHRSNLLDPVKAPPAETPQFSSSSCSAQHNGSWVRNSNYDKIVFLTR